MEPPRLPEAPGFTAPVLPAPLPLEAPVLELPRALVPSYQPILLPFAGSIEEGNWLLRKSSTAPDDRETKASDSPIKALVPQLPMPPIRQYEPRPVVSQQQQTLPSPQLAEAVNITIPGTAIQLPLPRAEIVSAAAVTSAISVAATLGATAMFKRLQSVFKPIIKTIIKKINNARHVPTLSFGRQRLVLRRCRRVHMGKKDAAYIRSLKAQHTSKRAQVRSPIFPWRASS